MECNKDEAIRAKEVAEKKMQNNDFEGAQRIAMRAQQLFPALDNISQLLEVCHVHICAGRKINGTEMDCYGILQVEKQADEITIKKQYRRLALILHPDKNKFPGAETAFKIIGEANRVLSDKGNRTLYDSKCSRLSVRTIPTKSKPPHQPNGIPPNALQAFWTKCPFCNTRFRYLRNVIHKALRCQSCMQPYIAYELDTHSTPHLYEEAPNVIPKIFPVFQNGSARTSTHANGASAPKRANQVGGDMGDKEKVDHMKGSARTSTDAKEASAPERAAQVGGDMRDKEKVDHMKSQRKAEVSGIQSKKRERDSEDSSDEGCKIKSPFNMRKSPRLNKTSHNETCKGTLGDDMRDNSLDDLSSREKFMPQNEISSSSPERSTEVQQHKEACEEGTSIGKDASVAINSKIIQDPEFYNFDKEREKKCFHINQLWACYGEEDKMPRFYVVIRKVFSSEFRLRVTWLEPHLEGQMKINLSTDLPISSGKFKLGNTKETTDISTFSHLVHFEKGSNRGSYLIYPKRGETWALFKNRKMNLSSELEIVEIVSNHVVGVGIDVATLGKIKGFFSLFKRKPKENGSVIFQISDLLKFSHRIPSYRLTGNEREGVPEGCFELDPAALPNDVEYCELEPNGVFPNTEKLQQPRKNQRKFSRKVNPTDNKPMKTEEHVVPKTEDKNFVDLTASSGPSKKENVSFVSPAGKILQEFYNFVAEKSEINFLPDQIWAMYDNDGLPKKYAKIKKIQSSPFRLYVLMLEAQMPCGTFKISAGKPKPFAPTAFSHIVKAELFGNNRIDIYPKAGEVWALDKNWDDTFQSSNMKIPNYEIAEVLESDNEQFVRISLLHHLKGSKTVFKGARGRSMSSCIMDIPWKEVERFSYQIPAYKFTTERNGLLRGCWELDPAALPKNVLHLEQSLKPE